ncbi:MAG: formylglycine-generating enzyme family protein [Kiritimatiellia bacterium]
MKRMINRAVLAAAAAFMATGAAYAAAPSISNVVMTQQEGSRIVKITYDLANEAAIVTLGIETNNVAIPDGAVTRLTGDVCKVVQPGSRTITWNAGADWPENLTQVARAKVVAWTTNAPPLYCAVDVVGGTSAADYPVYYYVSAEAVPEGVTNDLYKTTRILMRQIPATGAGGFEMGSPEGETGRNNAREAKHTVVLTKAFYAGVYEVTQSQWQQVMGDVQPWPSWLNNNDYRLTRPVEDVSYYEIRENNDNTAMETSWPQSDAVAAGSFMGRLRSKTVLGGFDLPTEAQWEYACRAGKTGALNDGTVNITNVTSDAQLGALGRYKFNGGYVDGTVEPARDCTTANASAAVGSYAPNMWGLYDMHGNVFEWCLDWHTDNIGTAAAEDPVGLEVPLEGSPNSLRGGSWFAGAEYCRSANRGADGGRWVRHSSYGFRLVRNLP